MVKEFKDFLMRGKLVELAVAVVVGTAFAALVKALVDNLVTPLIAAVFGEPSFGDFSFTINGSHFTYGLFINALVTFISVSAAIFFLVIKPIGAIEERRKRGLDPDTKKCPECLSEIPFAARRCAHCTSELDTAPAAGA